MTLRAGIGAVLAAVAWISSSGAPARAADTQSAAGGIVEVPVAFQVVNSDTSGAPCNPARPSDGRTYTVRGHLTGPRAALLAQRSGAVTLYLFGYEGGEWNWDLKNVSGYDYAAEMARLGHVSLTIDELCYGASGHPNGNDTCMGAQADVAHQIVSQLRAGNYTFGSGSGVPLSAGAPPGPHVGGPTPRVEGCSAT